MWSPSAHCKGSRERWSVVSRGRRVAVTGIGCVTAIGQGVDGLWAGLRRGVSGVRTITRFDPTPFRTHIGAEVTDFAPEERLEPRQARRLGRFSGMAVCAADMAMADAGLDRESLDGDRTGVQLGSALGGVDFAEEQHANYLARGVRGVNPLLALSVFGGAASCNLAIHFGFTGENSTNAMSCASGAIAIGHAFRLIRGGQLDVALGGGAEVPLSPLAFGAFAIIRAMSTRNADPTHACRPFDRDRDGFVMGEGAAILVLEEMGHAVRRDARVYAEVCGFGTTNDAHHMTAPLPDGTQAARCMRLALADAGVGPGVVDYINAHASSTPLNDSTEARAIRAVCGERADAIPASGTKAYYGHALGASGAIEAAIGSLALYREWVPPTLNLEQPDEACDLRHVREGGASLQAEYLLSNSFGFGGINATLLMKRAEN